MIDILKSILFGIVEGITEWLPVSSTGHLIILNDFVKLGVTEKFQRMFDVVIQLGAILAVIVLYFHKLNPFSPKKDHKQKKRTWELWFKVVLSIIPSGLLGILLDEWMELHLHNSVVVSMTLILYGIAFILVERRNKGHAPKIKNVYEIDYKTALLIGCFQCLSLIPGTSRSGSTILGAILIGVSRSAGSEFSFFMAIPTMLGASAIKLLKYFLETGFSMGGMDIAILLTGMAVSFVVSLLVIQELMKFVRKRSFAPFGYYRIALGVVVLAYFFLTMGKAA